MSQPNQLERAHAASSAGALLRASLAALCVATPAALAIDIPLDELSSGGSQIPDAPIELGVSPPPVVLLMLDDSLSMSSTLLTKDIENQATYPINTLNYRWTYPLPQDAPANDGAYTNAYLHRLAVPDQRLVDAWNDDATPGVRDGAPKLADEYDGAWRAMSHSFNELYYDPLTTYEPWPYGVDSAGNPYGDADPSAARTNPYEPASAIDLTATFEFETPVMDADGNLISIEHTDYCRQEPINILGTPICFAARIDLSYSIPHYNVWDDTNGNGAVDADDNYVRVDITTADPTQLQNFANWFVYHRSRELVAKGALSGFMSNVGDAYIGTASVNDQAGSEVEPALLNNNPETGVRRQIMNAIFATRGNVAGSPLREALNAAGTLFECSGGNLYGNSDCPRLTAADDGQCQRSATILITDAFDSLPGSTVTTTSANGSAGNLITISNSSGLGNADGDGNTAFDGGIYADTFSGTLADVAMHYYERDFDATLDSRQFMSTYVVNLGATGTLASPGDGAGAWPDPATSQRHRLDDALHAAFNSRGGACAATDEQLITKLGGALELTAGQGQATTSIGISSGSILRDQQVFLATFDRDSLTGDVEAFDINLDGTLGEVTWSAADRLDVDTAGVGFQNRLVLTYNHGTRGGMPFSWDQFNSPSYRTQQVAALNLPPEVLGTIEQLLDVVNPVLATVGAVGGTVLDPAIQGIEDAILGPVLDASGLAGFGAEDLLSSIESPLVGSEIDVYDFLGFSRGLSQARVEYIKGSRANEVQNGGTYRTRESVLGPIYHSKPVVVGPPDFDYPDNFLDGVPGADADDVYNNFRIANASRRSVVYVGANDGMLHGFDAQTGEEIFAYIPGSLLGKVGELSDVDYNPQTYVDGRISVVDAYDEFPACGANTSCWRTILVGSLRGGGQAIYALDVTDPELFANAGSTLAQQQLVANTTVLWEFSDSPTGAGITGMVNGGKFLVQGLLTDGLYDIFDEVLDPAFVEGIVTDTIIQGCEDVLGVGALACSVLNPLATIVTTVVPTLGPLLGLEDGLAGLPAYPTVADLTSDVLEDLIPTDEQFGSPELGFTFGQPNITRMADGRWTAIFGNGYHSTDVDLGVGDQTDPDIANLGFSVTGNSVVFVVDLATGSFRPNTTATTFGDMFDTGVGNFISPNNALNNGDEPLDVGEPDLSAVSISDLGVPGARPNGMADVAPIDFDGDGIIEQLYAGDERGNLWRIDTNDSDSGDWDFTFTSGGDPLPLFDASTASSSFQPITTRPEVAPHPSNLGTIVLFGTGKFHETEDLEPDSQAIQSFYGIWDRYDSNDTPDISVSDLALQEIEEQSTVSFDRDGDGTAESAELRITSQNSVNYVGANADEGWYMPFKLDSATDTDGERILGDPRLRNGQISFASVIPGESKCRFEGVSWFYRLDAATGGRTFVPPIDQVIDGQFASAIKNDAIAELPTVLLTPEGKEVNLQRDATGEVSGFLTDPGGFERQRATWRELR